MKARVWVSLIAACLQTLTAGAMFANVSYSARIPGLSPNDAPHVFSLALGAGLIVVLPCGMLFDWSGSPRLLSFLAAIIGAFAWIAESMYNNESTYVTALLLGLASLSASLAYVSALNSGVLLVSRQYRGAIVGILEACFGLSSVIYTQVALATSIVDFFRVVAIMVVVTNVFSMAVMSIDDAVSLDDRDNESIDHDTNKDVKEDPSFDETTLLINAKKSNGKKTQFDFGELMRLLRSSVDYWASILVFCTLTASVLVAMTAAPLVLKKQMNMNISKKVVSNVVVVCNAAARVVVGVLSDQLKERFSIPRSIFLVIAILSALAGAILLRMESSPVLTFALIGTALGSMFIMPAIVSEIWGEAGFGARWGLVLAASAFSLQAAEAIAGHDVEIMSTVMLVVCALSVPLTMKLMLGEYKAFKRNEKK